MTPITRFTIIRNDEIGLLSTGETDINYGNDMEKSHENNQVKNFS